MPASRKALTMVRQAHELSPAGPGQLERDRTTGARHTTEELDHRRRRNRQAAVLGDHRATAH